MKKLNKKGFTIVELVIVIAVIAILAAVLIPTLTNVVAKAKKSAALQEATSAYHAALADFYEDDVLTEYVAAAGETPASGDYYEDDYFIIKVVANASGELEFNIGTTSAGDDRYSDYTFSITDGVVTVEDATTGD